MLRERDRLRRGVRARARYHGNATLRLRDAPFDHPPVLVGRQRRALAGGADRDQAVGTFRDLPIHQATKGFLVERSVAEGGDERGKRASEARPGGHGAILYVVRAATGPTSRRIARSRPETRI